MHSVTLNKLDRYIYYVLYLDCGIEELFINRGDMHDIQ